MVTKWDLRMIQKLSLQNIGSLPMSKKGRRKKNSAIWSYGDIAQITSIEVRLPRCREKCLI